MLDPMAVTDQSFLALCALSLLRFSLFVCVFVSGFRSLLCLVFPTLPCLALHCTSCLATLLHHSFNHSLLFLLGICCCRNIPLSIVLGCLTLVPYNALITLPLPLRLSNRALSSIDQKSPSSIFCTTSIQYPLLSLYRSLRHRIPLHQSVSSVWYPARRIAPKRCLAAPSSFSNLRISTCCSISLRLNSMTAMFL
jgi:hypothetical protein